MSDVHEGGQSSRATELIERARHLGEMTPYQGAREKAIRQIGLYASSLISDLKPFNPNLAQTVIMGRPRRTHEAQAIRNAKARERLPELVLALRDPDQMSRDLIAHHEDVVVGIFALRESDRLRLADEYQAALAEHATKAA